MDRAEKISRLVSQFSSGVTASEVAHKMGVSRQRIDQLIKNFGINYQNFREYRRRIKKVKKMTRRCAQCGWSFIIKEGGSTIKFCSPECLKKYRKNYSRVWHREYYKSDKGKAYRQKIWQEKYGKLNLDITKECPTCLQKFHPPMIYPKMKYCSKKCYYLRTS